MRWQQRLLHLSWTNRCGMQCYLCVWGGWPALYPVCYEHVIHDLGHVPNMCHTFWLCVFRIHLHIAGPVAVA
jgi:hypothetical protein